MAQLPSLIVTITVWCGRLERSTIHLKPSVTDKSVRMLKFALLVRFKAKPGKEIDVLEFLKSAYHLACEEQGTPVWFALRLSDTEFGIFDAFDDEASRSSHLAGNIAKQLLQKADELLADAPRIEKVELVAAKIKM